MEGVSLLLMTGVTVLPGIRAGLSWQPEQMDLALEVLTGSGRGDPQFFPDCVPPLMGPGPPLRGTVSPATAWAGPSLLGHSSCSSLGRPRPCLLALIHAACCPAAIAGGESERGELGSFKESLCWAGHTSDVT